MSDARAAGDLPRGIGRPATAALALAGFTRLDQLAGVRASDLLALHGVGPKAIRVLSETLAAAGLSFAAEPEGSRPRRRGGR